MRFPRTGTFAVEAFETDLDATGQARPDWTDQNPLQRPSHRTVLVRERTCPARTAFSRKRLRADPSRLREKYVLDGKRSPRRT